jgi:hypothetical protein
MLFDSVTESVCLSKVYGSQHGNDRKWRFHDIYIYIYTNIYQSFLKAHCTSKRPNVDFNEASGISDTRAASETERKAADGLVRQPDLL